MMVFIRNGKTTYSGRLVLSPIENQMRQVYAHAHIAKPWRQTNPRQEQQKVPKNKEMMSD
jgi:hypothetical protein